MYPLQNMNTSTVFQMPERMIDSAWLGHIPFCMWLIQELKPKITVELGVHNGASLCAMLQASTSLGLDGHFFGVDHWAGDLHSGHLQPSVYWNLRAYQLAKYRHNASLLRKSFDKALDDFSDASIDLLHIDGYHTYDAVKHDFESWLPKLKASGIVMFHDISVIDNNFGVHKLWSELNKDYPTFHFDHSYGLGVACVGPRPQIKSLAELFESESLNDGNLIRSYFTRLGQAIMIFHENETLRHMHNEIKNETLLKSEEISQLKNMVHSLESSLEFAESAERSHLQHIYNLELKLKSCVENNERSSAPPKMLS